MNNFKELKVWQKSVDLAVQIYKISAKFPSEEKYGLISQIRRSAVSISSNIAEGAGRGSKKDFNNFLSYANGSSYELETQLIISKMVDFLENENFDVLEEHLIEIQKMIYSLKKSLN